MPASEEGFAKRLLYTEGDVFVSAANHLSLRGHQPFTKSLVREVGRCRLKPVFISPRVMPCAVTMCYSIESACVQRYDKPLSDLAFKFNLRRYTEVLPARSVPPRHGSCAMVGRCRWIPG